MIKIVMKTILLSIYIPIVFISTASADVITIAGSANGPAVDDAGEIVSYDTDVSQAGVIETENEPGSISTATITFAGFTYVLPQPAVSAIAGNAESLPTPVNPDCNPMLESSYESFPSDGGAGSLNLNWPGCASRLDLTAVSNADWILIKPTARGNPQTRLQIGYSVMENDSGMNRTGTIIVAGLKFKVIQGSASPISRIGVFKDGVWHIDSNGNGYFDISTCPSCPAPVCYDKVLSNFGYGISDVQPVMGDWDGNNIKRAGLFAGGIWYFDMDDSGVLKMELDQAFAETAEAYDNTAMALFGQKGDIPVVGDWTGDGKDKIGVFRNGQWYLDLNGNGRFDGCSIDACYSFGQVGDIPVVGDWTGDGKAKIGVFRNGWWYLDMDGNGEWNRSYGPCPMGSKCFFYSKGDQILQFGLPTDYPVVGNWAGKGKSQIGVYRNGTWFLYMGNIGSWGKSNNEVKTINNYGGPGWLPVVGN